MNVGRVPLGEVLALHREPVSLGDAELYGRIGIYSWGKGLFWRELVPGLEMGSLKYFKVPAGALVISNIQAWEGALALSSPEDAQRLGSNRFLSYLAVDDDEVDVRYVLHYLLSEDGFADVQRASPGTQVRNRTLSRDKFEAIRVPLPSIDEQRSIADRLDRLRAAATSLADGRLHLNAVEVVAGEREWGTPLSELLVLDVDEFDVEDDAVYQRAGVLSAGRGLFSQGELRGQDTKYRRLRKVRSGQIVLSRLTAFIGGVAYVQPAFDGFVVSQEYPTFSLCPGVLPEYVQSSMTTADVGHQLRGASAGVGNTRQRVSAEAFLAIRVPSLTAAEQQRVADLHRRLVRHEELVSHRATVAAALLPAARNEVFSRLG